jgi:hypothetical protein
MTVYLSLPYHRVGKSGWRHGRNANGNGLKDYEVHVPRGQSRSIEGEIVRHWSGMMEGIKRTFSSGKIKETDSIEHPQSDFSTPINDKNK